jgi:hypothetical protein
MEPFTINIPPMLAYIPYMDPMGYGLGWFMYLSTSELNTFENSGSLTASFSTKPPYFPATHDKN